MYRNCIYIYITAIGFSRYFLCGLHKAPLGSPWLLEVGTWQPLDKPKRCGRCEKCSEVDSTLCRTAQLGGRPRAWSNGPVMVGFIGSWLKTGILELMFLFGDVPCFLMAWWYRKLEHGVTLRVSLHLLGQDKAVKPYTVLLGCFCTAAARGFS